MADPITATAATSAHDIEADRQPGHWLLASLGKRVLRPGGLELTRWMLSALNVSVEDDVVEFAPGLGVTARMVLAAAPRSYVAIEKDSLAAKTVRQWLSGTNRHCIEGSVEHTSLPPGSATVVYGEAILSMQTPAQKARIVGEAWRILRPKGRYGIHELCLAPDDIPPAARRAIQRELSLAIHVGVQPLTGAEWRQTLERSGFEIHEERRAPMHLLEPKRVLQDEGLLGALRIAFNVARKPGARARVIRMRNLFRDYADHLAAISLIAVKPQDRLKDESQEKGETRAQ